MALGGGGRDVKAVLARSVLADPSRNLPRGPAVQRWIHLGSPTASGQKLMRSLNLMEHFTKAGPPASYRGRVGASE